MSSEVALDGDQETVDQQTNHRTLESVRDIVPGRCVYLETDCAVVRDCGVQMLCYI